MQSCSIKACPEEVLHKLEWRIRGPVEPGGPRDRISGGTGNLAYACAKHLEVLRGMGGVLKVKDTTFSSDQCARWIEHLEALTVLPYDPDVLLADDLTRAEAKAVLKKAQAASEKLAAFITLFDGRANPATLS